MSTGSGEICWIPETYENYLRGRHFLARRNAEAMNEGCRLFS